ncbi:hypothetical protein K439DRAFT_1614786 [Ramaria rubella]|nr:hypothetical protein K439DRAFT_1614786 [Ramaria rubella]
MPQTYRRMSGRIPHPRTSQSDVRVETRTGAMFQCQKRIRATPEKVVHVGASEGATRLEHGLRRIHTAARCCIRQTHDLKSHRLEVHGDVSGFIRIRDGLNAIIDKIEWRKRMVPPYHEFLVIYVVERIPAGSQVPAKSVLLIERNADGVRIPPENENKENDGVQTYGQPSPLILEATTPVTNPRSPLSSQNSMRPFGPTDIFSSSSPSSSVSNKPLNAIDQVYFSTKGNDAFVYVLEGDNYTCKTLTLSEGSSISVTQLLLLAKVVNEYHRSYELLQYQCFWYASMIYMTIEKLDPSSEEVTKKLEQRKGEHPLGTFLSCEVRQGTPQALTDILRLYNEAWEEEEALSSARRAEEKEELREEGRQEGWQEAEAKIQALNAANARALRNSKQSTRKWSDCDSSLLAGPAPGAKTFRQRLNAA